MTLYMCVESSNADEVDPFFGWEHMVHITAESPRAAAERYIRRWHCRDKTVDYVSEGVDVLVDDGRQTVVVRVVANIKVELTSEVLPG